MPGTECQTLGVIFPRPNAMPWSGGSKKPIRAAVFTDKILVKTCVDGLKSCLNYNGLLGFGLSEHSYLGEKTSWVVSELLRF